MRKTLVLLCAAAALGLAAPAHADTVLQHRLWACEEPYSGQRECGPPMVIQPGGYLWVGQATKGPNVYTVYTGEGAGATQVGWGEMTGSGVAGRMYTNYTSQAVLVHVFEHADAPEDRCGTVFEHGFYESRL
ncbi:hypothetical protein [Kitasatospora kifunensis]|uniref:Secreted protein n=1 Tax=Kitasatospora kifunensis TaxID=58351 RepID=A0A7W7VWV8_KITKI|nr:hypothetical protein [Kitasatospora kifunensis]MBB4925094.1 hypothetical protein [Kitasatospora kifunensis]